MAIESDVLVIGNGLAGSIAALAASRAGADVRVVSESSSSLRQASGLIDVLGYRYGDGPLAEPFEAIPESGGHPYAKAGEDAIRNGLTLFDDVVRDLYRGDHTDRNALVPTAGGRLKPTARYPRSVEAGLASDRRPCLLVGFDSYTGFDAPLAAARLRQAGVPFEVRGVTIEFPLDFRADAATTRYARALDRDEGGCRKKIATRIRSHLAGEERVGLPAFLGMDRVGEVTAALSDRLGLPVFEVPTGPPSVPGKRLGDQLTDALHEADVPVSIGEPVVDYEAEDGGIDLVLVGEKRHVPYGADQFVLATGGLVGGGIDSNREEVREPIFDCHVGQPDDRDDWYEDDAFDEHEFTRFGVDVDCSCRPLTGANEPEFENLRAAGAVIGGADSAAEKSGSGVSIATGYVAGTMAGEKA